MDCSHATDRMDRARLSLPDLELDAFDDPYELALCLEETEEPPFRKVDGTSDALRCGFRRDRDL